MGLYQPNTATDYAVVCQNFGACTSASFTTRTGPTSRFLCGGDQSCTSATFNCRSSNCDLNCGTGFAACFGVNYRCQGGNGKTCTVQCNGGCSSGALYVTCENYPCNVTITGTQNIPGPCPAGQNLCSDGSCVASNVTQCPSRCIRNDPCQTAVQGNTCRDLGTFGGPINCTCNAPGYMDGATSNGTVTTCVQAPTPKPTSTPTRTPTTSAPTTPTVSPRPTQTPTSPTAAPTGAEGYSLTVTRYSNNNCTGTPSSTVDFPTGACASGTPGPGQFAITRCTATKFCQILGTGTCGGFNFMCSPSVDANVCLNGTMAVCNMNFVVPGVPGGFLSGAGQVGGTLTATVAFGLTTLLF